MLLDTTRKNSKLIICNSGLIFDLMFLSDPRSGVSETAPKRGVCGNRYA